MVAPRVTIVSSATGSEYAGWTQAWLDSVGKSEFDDWSIELVDDGGELEPLLRVDDRTTVHPVAKQPSISAAFNLALAAGLLRDPDFVILLTTSTRPTRSDWIAELTDRVVAHPEVGVAGTRNVNDDGTLNHAGGFLMRQYPRLITGHIGREVERRTGLDSIERYVEWVTGACFLIRTRLLYFGLRFDPRLIQNCNDTDFCLQALETGYRTLYVPSVEMWRDEGHTRGSKRYRIDPTVDWVTFCRKWQGRRTPWV